MVFDWFITNDFIWCYIESHIVGQTVVDPADVTLYDSRMHQMFCESLLAKKSHIATLLHDSSWMSWFILQWKHGKVTPCPWLSNIVPHHFIRPVPTGFKHSSVSFLPPSSIWLLLFLWLNYWEILYFFLSFVRQGLSWKKNCLMLYSHLCGVNIKGQVPVCECVVETESSQMNCFVL